MPREPHLSDGTDAAWEAWGQHEPYFGVITDPRFRRAALTEDSRAAFFDSGRHHVDYVMQMIRQHIDPQFSPQSVLDFGCGVGRIAIPFAQTAREVLGIDVSRAMLDEMQKNCIAQGAMNIKGVISDDLLSGVTGRFDLVHSFIVFQHIPPQRGIELLRHLLLHIAPDGVGALHFTYSKQQFANTNGRAPAPEPALWKKQRIISLRAPNGDPEMQMNAYDSTEILFLLQTAGATRLHIEFTDHGGELGLFVFFKLPG